MPPLITEADLEDAVLTRLDLLGSRVEGVKRSFKGAPAVAVRPSDLPCVYTLTGNRVAPTAEAAGQFAVIRNFVMVLLLKPITGGINDPETGAEAYSMGVPFLSRFSLFFARRLNLQDHDTPALRGTSLVSILDGGIRSRAAPGGKLHSAIDFTLTITMVFRADQIAAPF